MPEEISCPYKVIQKKINKCDCQVDFKRISTPFTYGVDFKSLPGNIASLITVTLLDYIFQYNLKGSVVSEETMELLKKVLVTLDGEPMTHCFTVNQEDNARHIRYTLSY